MTRTRIPAQRLRQTQKGNRERTFGCPTTSERSHVSLRRTNNSVGLGRADRPGLRDWRHRIRRSLLRRRGRSARMTQRKRPAAPERGDKPPAPAATDSWDAVDRRPEWSAQLEDDVMGAGRAVVREGRLRHQSCHPDPDSPDTDTTHGS